MKRFKRRLLITFLNFQARVFYLISKILKLGSGTSLPGYLIEKRYVNCLEYFNNKYKKVILITGTNGKTTTRAIINSILEVEGLRVVSNRGGANIIRGIAGTLLLDLNFFNKPKSDILVLEVEEASLPILSRYLKTDILIITNLFRDQLDVYGGLDTTIEYFKVSCKNIYLKNKTFNLVYNLDDALLKSTISKIDLDIIQSSFSISDSGFVKPKYEITNRDVNYNFGTLYCTKIQSKEEEKLLTLMEKNQIINLKFHLSGDYNIYNLLAAYLATKGLASLENIRLGVEQFKPVFGRGEKIIIGNCKINLMLIKNPAGFEEVLKTINKVYEKKSNIIFIINDNIADSKDVSWLWDVDLENLLKLSKFETLSTAGTRGLDMKLRLEVAGIDREKIYNFKTLNILIKNIIKNEGNYNILCTYTAMMEIRRNLSNHVKLENINSKYF